PEDLGSHWIEESPCALATVGVWQKHGPAGSNEYAAAGFVCEGDRQRGATRHMNIPTRNIPLIDSQTGHISLPWYQFFQFLATAVGVSPTAVTDALVLASWPDTK
ncbi:MAG: hypothetical protein ACREDR_00310, partial [Blastocatellia bacterium]